jgi:Ca-activated chloride channel family protein
MPCPRLLALVLLALLSPAFAQAPTPAPAQASTPPDAVPPTATLKVASRIVAVSAIARDKSGQPVPNLTRDDFLLKQDGKPQPITYFSQGSSLPLTLALMVDTSGSQRAYIGDEIAAGRAFFPAMLTRPTTAPSSSSSTPPSCSSSRSPPPSSPSSTASPISPSLTPTTAPAARRHAPLRRRRRRLHIELGNQFGRRAMVILTDGGDNGSHFSQKTPSARPSAPTS